MTLVLLWSGQAAAAAGDWSSVATKLSVPRGLLTCELRALHVSNGRVLVAGGVSKGGAGRVPRAEVDIFSGGQFSPGAPMAVGRAMTANVALVDGGALVAGGGTTFGLPALDTVERWNATTGQWSGGIQLKAKRFAATATRLKDGRVLILGGQDGWTGVTSAEIFDPATSTTKLTAGSMAEGRVGQVAALLEDGRVFVWGGSSVAPAGGPQPTPPSTTYLFNPTTEQFGPGPQASRGAAAHGGARLADGRILICGGCNQMCNAASFRNCDLYTPTPGGMGSLRSTGALNTGSGAQVMITLPSGQVLIVGGVSSGAALARAELYDPATERWTLTRTQPQVARYDPGVALLADGRVLVVGGRQGPPNNNEVFLDSAEIYDPGLPRSCRVQQLEGTVDVLADGASCDDGDPATVNDTCTAGTCTPGPRLPPPDAAAPPDAGGGAPPGPDAAPPPDLALPPDLAAPPDAAVVARDAVPPAPDAPSAADLALLPPLPPDAPAATPPPADAAPPPVVMEDAAGPAPGSGPKGAAPAKSGGGCTLTGGTPAASSCFLLVGLLLAIFGRARRR